MQIVGYDRTPDAGLHIATDGAVKRVPLAVDETIEYGLLERDCAGSVFEHVHQPCDRSEVPWCPDHTDTWICARCRGTCLKDEMDCYDPHVVYLALVAPDVVKVGVTKAARIETRLHEQGADCAAVIHEVANGRIAREIEAEIGRDLPERIPIGAKIAGLTASVDEERWTGLLDEFDPIDVYRPEYALTTSSQPIHETLASGRVLGTKGRLLVLETAGSTYVTDLRDLVGHHVATGEHAQRVQSGLGAFG